LNRTENKNTTEEQESTRSQQDSIAPDNYNLIEAHTNDTVINSGQFKIFGNISGYDVGSFIPPNLLKDFIYYSYDNSIYTFPTIHHDVDISRFDRDPEQSPELQTRYYNSELQALSSYTNEYDNEVEYDVGEIFPAYTLVPQITNIDINSDSHFLYGTLKLGVCPTSFIANKSTIDSTVIPHIVWLDDIAKENQDDELDTNVASSTDLTFSVKLTANDIRYVAQNYHYNNQNVVIDTSNGSKYRYETVDGDSDTIKIIDKKAGTPDRTFANADDLISRLSVDNTK
jgi:hypothetical protein